jgi:hypothetical protein
MQPQLDANTVSNIEEFKTLVGFDGDDSVPSAGSKRAATKKSSAGENTSGGYIYC